MYIHICEYMCIICACVHITTINEKKGYVFGKKQWEVYGNVRKEEREAGNVITILKL